MGVFLVGKHTNVFGSLTKFVKELAMPTQAAMNISTGLTRFTSSRSRNLSRIKGPVNLVNPVKSIAK